MSLKFETKCFVEQVGSTVTCNPPPTDTDTDFLIYVLPELFNDLNNEVIRLGYLCDTNEYVGTEFYSYRFNKINLIVTTDKQFHIKFKTATHLAKKFNLLLKQDRIDLFQAVLYNNI